MVTTNVEDIYELSPLQQGMLLHTMQDSSGDMYLGQDVYIVDGPLDTDLLIEAWQQVFADHPALRTSFQWEGLEQPLQIVHRTVTPPTHLDDWRGRPEEEQRELLDEILSKDRTSGFDLTAPPLQRLLVVRLDDERHALAWTHHHLLMDGWSVPLFMNEVMSHYRRLTVGGPGPAPAPPFRDYIAWLSQQDMDAAREFWSDTLGGVRRRPLRGLRPVDPRRPTGEPRRHVVDIADRIEDGMRAAAARHRVTPTTVLDAAWAAVLHRHAASAGSEVVVGCVSSGRSPKLPGADRMIGMLINTLPVAVHVPEDGDVGDWLRQVQWREAAAREYEYSPLAEIKKWVGAPGQQLFDSLIVYANYDFGVVDDGPLIVRSQNTFDKVSVPLAVTLTPRPVSQLQLIWHEDRFDESTVDALKSGLLAALDDICSAERTSSILSAVAATVPAAPADLPGPAAQAGAASPASPATSPPTPEEKAIAAVWCDVLELADVDVTANFFDLGGDSFTAVRVASRIDGATVALLALHPTVRDLVLAIESSASEDLELEAEIEELERQLAATPDLAAPSPTPTTPAAPQDEDGTDPDAVEFERMKEVLLRHLPPAPATVADIGGGLGRYALWLAGLGYTVRHRDTVPSCVDRVRAAASAAGLALDTAVGDARNLALDDQSVDAALLLGALWQQPSRDDRREMIREARRIVRPGGVVCGGAGTTLGPALEELAAELADEGLDVADPVSVERGALLVGIRR